MKMKKLLATILATTLACGTIVGCGGGTADSSKSSAGEIQQKVVTEK